MIRHLQRGLTASVLVAMMGLSSLLVVPSTPAIAASPCASAPDAISLSLVIDVEPGQNIFLQGSGGPPFTQSAHVTVTCTIDNSVVPNATVRVWASNSPGIDVSTLNGSQTGGTVLPAMLFMVTSATGTTPPCGGAASALNFCDVTTDASGVAVFTITSPTPNPAAAGGAVLIGSHREQVRQAFGQNLFVGPDPITGTYIGAQAGGQLFAVTQSPDNTPTPELDSFVLFGAGALALAGFVGIRRRRLPFR